MTNDAEGALWESEVIDRLREEGWMAFFMPKARDGGQPFDISAFCAGTGYLIECKVCHEPRLDLTRIKENQLANMRAAFKTRNHGRIYLKYIDKGGMTSYHQIWWNAVLDAIDAGKSSIPLSDMRPLVF